MFTFVMEAVQYSTLRGKFSIVASKSARMENSGFSSSVDTHIHTSLYNATSIQGEKMR